MPATRLVGEIIGRHADELTPAEREQVGVEIGALREAVDAGRV